MRYLLDVNVVLALIDPDHVWHEMAQGWFDSTGGKAWATCPIVQNGVLRIAGHPRYPNSPGTPAGVAKLLVRFFALPGHEFWSDEISLLSHPGMQIDNLSHSTQVTDTYLLALASSRGGQLATFDRRMVTNTVDSGDKVLHLIA